MSLNEEPAHETHASTNLALSHRERRQSLFSLMDIKTVSSLLDCTIPVQPEAELMTTCSLYPGTNIRESQGAKTITQTLWERTYRTAKGRLRFHWTSFRAKPFMKGNVLSLLKVENRNQRTIPQERGVITKGFASRSTPGHSRNHKQV